VSTPSCWTSGCRTPTIWTPMRRLTRTLAVSTTPTRATRWCPTRRTTPSPTMMIRGVPHEQPWPRSAAAAAHRGRSIPSAGGTTEHRGVGEHDRAAAGTGYAGPPATPRTRTRTRKPPQPKPCPGARTQAAAPRLLTRPPSSSRSTGGPPTAAMSRVDENAPRDTRGRGAGTGTPRRRLGRPGQPVTPTSVPALRSSRSRWSDDRGPSEPGSASPESTRGR
jgi:hypothetical protein